MFFSRTEFAEAVRCLYLLWAEWIQEHCQANCGLHRRAGVKSELPGNVQHAIWLTAPEAALTCVMPIASTAERAVKMPGASYFDAAIASLYPGIA